MATITAQGLVDDGTANLTVAGTETVNAQVMSVNVFTSTTASVIPTPGFWQVAAQVGCTASLPSPATFPGAHLLVQSTTSGSYKLLGQMTMMTGSTVGATLNSKNGTTASMGDAGSSGPGASVGFWSNANVWMITALSGSLALT